MAKIDLRILLDRLVEENLDRGKPIKIQPDEFCDILTSGDYIEITNVKLNERVVLNHGPAGCSYPGYIHKLGYNGREFECSTSIEIIDMDYL